MGKLKRMFPSDRLKELAELARRSPAFTPLLKELLQVWFIVDASIIHGELRWRLRRKSKPDARSSFQEAVDAGLYIPVAPTHLKLEIEEHLAEIARDTGATFEKAEAEWRQVQELLLFYQPHCSHDGESTPGDPDDLPYKYASEELGVPVYSQDKHFPAMKVPVIAVCFDSTARRYARAASVTFGTTFQTTVTVTFAFQAFAAFCRAVKSLVLFFTRLPKGMQLFVAGLLAALLIHPKSRARLISSVKAIYNKAAEMRPEVLSGIAELLDELCVASHEVKQTGAEISSALPTPRKRSVLMYIRAAFVLGKTPLSVGELAKRIQAQGYVSRSQNFKAYLRRVMRKSRQFLEVSPGQWSLRGAPMNAG